MNMTRLLDIIFSFIGLIILMPLLFLLLLIAWLETGSPLFIQKRVGYNLNSFRLIKFRTMKVGTMSIGTHLINKSSVTFFGHFLRKTKLDELPQLWNVLRGNMSLVGPRPCLFNQKKLIQERKKRKVFNVRPGITGLAQIKGISMSTEVLLAQTDSKMIKKMSLFYYFYYIFFSIFVIFMKKL
jgi:lipopolysaccharide/colanic/teichoic acid biosynthesis glycosyltransferase